MTKYKYLVLLLVICLSLFMVTRENNTEKSINSADWDDEDFAKFSLAESEKIYKVFEDFPDSIFDNMNCWENIWNSFPVRRMRC